MDSVITTAPIATVIVHNGWQLAAYALGITLPIVLAWIAPSPRRKK
jgi:hypothetical protein